MAEEKGILATTPQRTTAILKVHFFYALMVLNGQSGEKTLSHSKAHKTQSKYPSKQAYNEKRRGRDNVISSYT